MEFDKEKVKQSIRMHQINFVSQWSLFLKTKIILRNAI